VPCLIEIVPAWRSLFLVAIASAALVSLTPSSPAQRLVTRDNLIGRLSNAEIFAYGGVGFALTISQDEISYHELLSYPSAAADFERVFVEGNPQGKAYPLVGLRQTNSKRFAELAASLQTSTTLVQIGQGCVVSDIPMHALLDYIRAGLFSSPMTRNPLTLP
jgi:hypothetical protein